MLSKGSRRSLILVPRPDKCRKGTPVYQDSGPMPRKSPKPAAESTLASCRSEYSCRCRPTGPLLSGRKCRVRSCGPVIAFGVTTTKTPSLDSKEFTSVRNESMWSGGRCSSTSQSNSRSYCPAPPASITSRAVPYETQSPSPRAASRFRADRTAAGAMSTPRNDRNPKAARESSKCPDPHPISKIRGSTLRSGAKHPYRGNDKQ